MARVPRMPVPPFLLVLILIFAGRASAQEEKPWLGEEPMAREHLPAIEVARDRAVRAKTLLANGDAAAAAEALGLASPPEASAVEEWRKAAEARAEALGDLLRYASERIERRTEEDIAKDLDAATKELATLQSRLKAEVRLEDGERSLPDYQADVARAEEAVRSARTLLETRQDKITGLEQQAPGFAGRLEELRSQHQAIEPEAGDRLAAYRRETLEIRIHALRERMTFAPEARRLWPQLLDLRKTQLAAAEAQLAIARRIEERARQNDLLQAREARDTARAAARRAEAKKEEAEAAGSPIAEFEFRLEERIQETLASAEQHRIDALELRPRIEEQKPITESLEESWEALQLRFETDRGVSARTPQILRANLKRVEQNRRALEKRLLPELESDLSEALTRRAEVQDQLLEIAPRLEEGPEAWLELQSKVPADEVDRAKEIWQSKTDGLRSALRREDTELEKYLISLEKLGTVYADRATVLDRIYSYVLARIYWVRNEDPMGLATLGGIRSEAGNLALAYTGPKLREDLGQAYRRGTWRFVFLALLLVGLLVASYWLVRRLRDFRKRWSYPGGPFLVALQRIGVTILISALAPGALALAAVLLGFLELPPLLSRPGRILLYGLAVALFARRFLWNFFRDDGIARTEFGAPAAVAEQLLRASRWVTFGFLAFTLPYWIASTIPMAVPLVHIPRVLYTLMLAFHAVVLLGLLRRRGALLGALTGHTGFWYRILFVLQPLLALGFFAIVGMDVLGYRFGAALLTKNVLQTFLWGLLLIGLYNLLTTVVEHSTNRMLARRRKEVSAREARKESQVVYQQLSRLAGVTLVMTAVLILARFWGLLDGLESFFGAVSLPKFSHVTLWDLMLTFAWIGAGHFVIRHLPALYEVLIFPRMEKTDAGTRYVFVAVSKYLVFLLAYSSALLTLKFSFTSLGVVLAAVSVGIGFGLQEIVANFISGLILFFERPVRVGDIVTVGTTVGTVERINIRATQVMNFDRQVMIIPNRQFIVGEVTNWTHNDLVVRGAIDVGVAYGTDVGKVGKLLLEIVREHPRVKQDPEPRFLFLNFGESSLNLRCWIYTDIADRLGTISEINETITRRFAEEGIQIPFPQRDLHVRSIQDDTLLAALSARPPKPPEPAPPEEE